MNLNTNLKVPLFLPFYTEKEPFHIPAIEKWHSFDIPSWELCINALSLRYELIKEPERFFNFFTAKKSIISPLGPFYRMKWQSSLPFHMLIPTLSYTWSLKKVPLLGGASPYRPLKGVPRSQGSFQLVPWSSLVFLVTVLFKSFFFHGFSCSVKFCWYFVVKI